jgi:hypothetical protein
VGIANGLGGHSVVIALTHARSGLLRIAARGPIVVLARDDGRQRARRGHMIPSRRQFVASIAAVPFLPQAAAAIGKEAIQSQPYSDPVLDAIVAGFQELRREGDEKPAQRRGAVRGFETLTGVLAAHLGKHYDPEMKRALRQQLQRKGRQTLVQEITSKINKPEITHEAIDAMVTRLERDGLGGVLRDVQRRIKRMRENMPPDYLQVRSATQFDFCSDLRWFIELAEMAAAIACAVAAGFGGLNPAADAACAGATAALAGYLVMKWWYGC